MIPVFFFPFKFPVLVHDRMSLFVSHVIFYEFGYIRILVELCYAGGQVFGSWSSVQNLRFFFFFFFVDRILVYLGGW